MIKMRKLEKMRIYVNDKKINFQKLLRAYRDDEKKIKYFIVAKNVKIENFTDCVGGRSS